LTATVHDQFVGVADESTYGTAVAPTDFYEILSEGINGSYERIESEAIRGPILRADRFAPNPKGAAGDFEVEVLDKGFDFWLTHMLGAVTTTGDGTTTPIVATAVPGDTYGKSFTLQVGRYASGLNALVPFTYSGGKVTEWEISCEVDGIVKAKVTCDFCKEDINNASGTQPLAVAAYPSGSQLLTFIGGTATIGGTAFPITATTLTGNNGLKVDRYAMRGATSTTKREPKEEAVKELTFSLSAEFENETHSLMVAGAIAADTLAAIVLHFDSPQGGALDITIPAARFDEGNVNAAGEIPMQELTGKILAPTDGTDAISVVYSSVL
jgi:hypothetical protein